MGSGLYRNFRLRACLRAGVAMLAAAGGGMAQGPAQIAPAQFDPSDVYFQGYLACRSAEQLESAGDFIGAAEKLEKARKLFGTVQMYYPAWKAEMVADRSAKNLDAITKLRPRADEQRLARRNAVAELEGGVKKPGIVGEKANTPIEEKGNTLIAPPPGVFETDPLMARRLAEAEAEVKRLRKLSTTVVPNADEGRNAARLRDMALQRDALQSQLKSAENTVQSLRAKLAANPLENEMKALTQRIADREQERDAMGMALNQSRAAHTDALSKIATLEADLNVMRQKHSDLDRDLKAERSVANAVVAGQRSQLQAMEKELALKSTELGKANERISGLMKELQESHDNFAQLRTERDSLLQERDQMSAMLKLNRDGRIQDLIQQNIGLAKSLREAEERVERLDRENNSSKDELTAAKRDLTMTKAQINRLKQERREQDTRIEDLQKRLKSEESALVSGQASADPTEVAVLRDIIQRQLRVQERRRQAKDLLVDAVRDLGGKDERVAKAIQLFDGEEIQLTPEEQRLIATDKVDGEFVSPYARDRESVGQATEQLNRDIAVFERTAAKSYAAGRLLPTRELFEMIVEQHPGHVPTLCKLGMVDLKLNDPAAAADTFRRAVELDANNPYAHRMLGYSLMTMGDTVAADQSLKEAVALAPDDAKTHLLLGIIANRMGRLDESEAHYKASISADPVPSEAYFNLALLYSRTKRREAAKSYYQQALERGAVPDSGLERRLTR